MLLWCSNSRVFQMSAATSAIFNAPPTLISSKSVPEQPGSTWLLYLLLVRSSPDLVTKRLNLPRSRFLARLACLYHSQIPIPQAPYPSRCWSARDWSWANLPMRPLRAALEDVDACWKQSPVGEGKCPYLAIGFGKGIKWFSKK